MKSASFILAALAASVSANPAKTINLHHDGVCKGMFMVHNEHVWLSKGDYDQVWNTAGVTELESEIANGMKFVFDIEWKDEQIVTGDCRGDWGNNCYITLLGDDTKYCQGTTFAGPPTQLHLAIQPPGSAAAAGGTVGTINHPRQEEHGSAHRW